MATVSMPKINEALLAEIRGALHERVPPMVHHLYPMALVLLAMVDELRRPDVDAVTTPREPSTQTIEEAKLHAFTTPWNERDIVAEMAATLRDREAPPPRERE